jgi:hypothetical protein
MEEIVGVLAWPLVVLIIALVALLLFRPSIGALIARTKKVGRGGIETFENQPAQPTEEKRGVEEFFHSFDNPLLVEAEQLILKDLEERRIDGTSDREKALVRALASTNIVLHFERVHGSLWASQLACLRYLNTRDQGAEVTEITPFYDLAKADYPTWYENYPSMVGWDFSVPSTVCYNVTPVCSSPWLVGNF